MDHPQAGQKAALGGISVPQCGHSTKPSAGVVAAVERSGELYDSPVIVIGRLSYTNSIFRAGS
jgi:hypothetical protein